MGSALRLFELQMFLLVATTRRVHGLFKGEKKTLLLSEYVRLTNLDDFCHVRL